MNYKVGDVVKVRKDLKLGGSYGGQTFVPSMKRLEKVTIRKIFDDRLPYYLVDENQFLYTDEMFEDDKSRIKVGDKVRSKAKDESYLLTGKVVFKEEDANTIWYLVYFGEDFQGHDGYLGPCGLTSGLKLNSTGNWWMYESDLDVIYDDDDDDKKITKFSTGAVRDEASGKPEMDLIPWDLMGRLAKHYGNGAKKYGKDNWRLGQNKSHTFASLIRHAMAYWAGKDDEDHLSAIIWNAFSLMNVDTYFKDNDDLNDLNSQVKADND